MRVHLINPSEVSFGTAVITPRWLYVLAAATPSSFGNPCLVDETLEPVKLDEIQAGDIVGIGIHTANALRGYKIGKLARERGAYVVFGGIHATLYPNEAHELGGAHAVVKGDGDVVWAKVLSDCCRGTPQSIYEEAELRAQNSCLRAGTWSHASVTCGLRYRRFGAAPSIAPSAQCGGPMGSVPVSAPPMLWFKRSLNCDDSGSALSRSLTTTSIL